jgi:hypothetical protein
MIGNNHISGCASVGVIAEMDMRYISSLYSSLKERPISIRRYQTKSHEPVSLFHNQNQEGKNYYNFLCPSTNSIQLRVAKNSAGGVIVDVAISS